MTVLYWAIHMSPFPGNLRNHTGRGDQCLGILETYDAASIIEAADQAAKTAIVDLIELRIAKGMCGKSYMLLTGEVSAVEASIERAKELVAEKRNVHGFLSDRSSGQENDRYDPLILSLYLRDILLKGIPAMTSEKEASYASIERRNLILEKLQEEKRVVVSELSQLYSVSEETIRRDLDKLEKEGLATKSYGGAVINEDVGIDLPLIFVKTRMYRESRKWRRLLLPW